jgi:hypothetical protein
VWPRRHRTAADQPAGVAGVVVGAAPLGPELEPDPDPMFGQFLVEEDVPLEPLELLGVVVLVDPEEFVEELLPVDELVPDPLAAVELVELVLGVLVAALATTAPPATRPLVRAPIASALRSRSLMVVGPSLLMVFVLPHMREHHHCAKWICGPGHRPVTTR